MNIYSGKSFDDLAFEDGVEMPMGTVVADYFEDGIRVIIMRGGYSFCCYVGVPESHPLAGFAYDDMPLDCHGGLTYSGLGDDDMRPKGYYWYGWDYAHYGDMTFNDLTSTPRYKTDAKKWTPKEIKKEAWDVVYEFKKLVAIAEKIRNLTR